MFVPTAVSVTCTPVALPPSSMPLPRLPETMQVRIRLLPPLEVIRIPSRRFGAAPPKAKMPAKVLNEVKPLALSRDLDAVLVVAGDHVAQRDHAADLRVRGRPRDEQAVAAVGDDRGVVGPDAQEVGLDRRVVGVGDPQAVAAVAAEHVVEDERMLAGTCSRSADCRWRLTMATPSRRLPRAELPEAVGADEVPAQRVLRWPRR